LEHSNQKLNTNQSYLSQFQETYMLPKSRGNSNLDRYFDNISKKKQPQQERLVNSHQKRK